RVVAVERDRDLVPILSADLDDAVRSGKLVVVEADAVKLDWREALTDTPRPHAVAGNLPYLITGRLLERATELAQAVDVVVFMVPPEAAAPLLARPATAAYGALTVFVQAAFAVDRVRTVRAGAFYPKPAVDSAVVRLTPLARRRAEETPAFQQAVKSAF